MKVVIGIPARFASTRFPGKPVAMLGGKPMLTHVIERSREAGIGEVFVATDDTRIADVAHQAGADVKMTREEHGSGSERLAEAIADIHCDIVINVQGDEPLIDPAAIRAVIEPFAGNPGLDMATLAHPIASEDDFHDPNVVKVVCDARGYARYFSRSPIPYPRNGGMQGALQHVGLYAYRREFLLQYPALPACETEQIEQLEQLRVLHHGHDIAVTVGPYRCIGVDTPEDLQRAEKRLLSQ